MATELQHKHLERKKPEEDFVKTTSKLKSRISFINITILHQINIALKRKCWAITYRQKKKLSNLEEKQKQNQKHNKFSLYAIQTVCNMSSYVLRDEEQLELSFDLDQHVLVMYDRYLIKTESDHFF